MYASIHSHSLHLDLKQRYLFVSLLNLMPNGFLQLLSHQEHVSESQERQVNLRKDLAEMQEWMAQVDEEFLMRDFEYKTPEELEASLDEMKVT